MKIIIKESQYNRLFNEDYEMIPLKQSEIDSKLRNFIKKKIAKNSHLMMTKNGNRAVLVGKNGAIASVSGAGRDNFESIYNWTRMSDKVTINEDILNEFKTFWRVDDLLVAYSIYHYIKSIIPEQDIDNFNPNDKFTFDVARL